jgi:hypothetical protein
VPERVKVRKVHVAALEAPPHEVAAIVDDQPTATVVHEQLRERRLPVGVTRPLLRSVERSQQVALRDRLTGASRETNERGVA